MKILKLLIRLLFRVKANKIGKLTEGGWYVMVYEEGALTGEDLKLLLGCLSKYNIKLFALPVRGKIDTVKFI